MDETIATPQPSKRGIHWILIGSNGIRAGWGVLLFVLVYGVVLFFSFWALRPYMLAMQHVTLLPLKLGLIAELAQCAAALVATAVLSRIERKSFFSYGYQGQARVRRFVSGLLWGLMALSALVLVLWRSGLLAFDGLQLHGAAIWTYGLGWGLFFVIVAITEESASRGYLQFTLSRGIGFWWGALLLSCLFGLSHRLNPGETPVGLFSAAAIGLFFCFSLWYTGSLWWALGFHAAWDWAESYFYGTSDSGILVRGHLLASHPKGPILYSGGATGPEGSLLVLGLIALMAILMWLWWGRRRSGTNPDPGTGAPWPRRSER